MARPDFGPNGERRIERAKLSAEERAARSAESRRRWKERNPEYARAWKQANADRHRAYSRATHQRASRKKRRNAKARQKYSENPEPHRERGRRFRRDHPDKVSEYKRRFRERHPERVAEQARRGSQNWRDRNADVAREKARISAAERRHADPEKFRAWYQANLERERARSRDASRLRSRLKALGLPARSVGKVYANEKRAHAVEADQFFQRRRTAGDVARVREELKPARAILDAAWRTDAKARFEPTPTHLLAAWARDSALARARLTRDERREMFAGYLAKHGDQLRQDAELDSRARVLRGAPPLDVNKEVKLRAAEALNEAERARLERIVARTMSSFGVPASEATQRAEPPTKAQQTAPTLNRPTRQNRER
jgi:hypothetical protein